MARLPAPVAGGRATLLAWASGKGDWSRSSPRSPAGRTATCAASRVRWRARTDRIRAPWPGFGSGGHTALRRSLLLARARPGAARCATEQGAVATARWSTPPPASTPSSWPRRRLSDVPFAPAGLGSPCKGAGARAAERRRQDSGRVRAAASHMHGAARTGRVGGRSSRATQAVREACEPGLGRQSADPRWA